MTEAFGMLALLFGLCGVFTAMSTFSMSLRWQRIASVSAPFMGLCGLFAFLMLISALLDPLLE